MERFSKLAKALQNLIGRDMIYLNKTGLKIQAPVLSYWTQALVAREQHASQHVLRSRPKSAVSGDRFIQVTGWPGPLRSKHEPYTSARPEL